MIELECLAIVWATLKCSFYLRGLPLFYIYTDRHPLQGVFKKDIFDLASPPSAAIKGENCHEFFSGLLGTR